MADQYGFGETIQHIQVLVQQNRIKVSFRETPALMLTTLSNSLHNVSFLLSR